MKAWFSHFWDGLNERERRAACVGVVGVLLYLAYAIYSPLKQAVLDNTTELTEKKATLAWMKVAKARFKPQKKGPEALDGSKGLTVFSEALSKASFHEYPYQLQQMPDGALQLSFDSVPYNDFLKWLWSMGQRYTIVIKTLNAEQTDTQGLVRLTIIVVL
ncbi:MAG: type II secretion system protein M [Gammaproteobacteria bacterium]|nr:type II secretion system protein M [Gammaproteobacteria bacterium]